MSGTIYVFVETTSLVEVSTRFIPWSSIAEIIEVNSQVIVLK